MDFFAKRAHANRQLIWVPPTSWVFPLEYPTASKLIHTLVNPKELVLLDTKISRGEFSGRWRSKP